MSALMLQVVPPVQIRPDTWLQRFGIGPKTLRPPVAVAWSGAGRAIYQTLAVKVTREGGGDPARKIATLYRGTVVTATAMTATFQVYEGETVQRLRGIGPARTVRDHRSPTKVTRACGSFAGRVLDADTRLPVP
ncbi:hypothetical protein P4050_00435 [Pseudomonas aeruginosa]|nr:hypothetical protein [Pseudomonas aeruginosa]